MPFLEGAKWARRIHTPVPTAVGRSVCEGVRVAEVTEARTHYDGVPLRSALSLVIPFRGAPAAAIEGPTHAPACVPPCRPRAPGRNAGTSVDRRARRLQVRHGRKRRRRRTGRSLGARRTPTPPSPPQRLSGKKLPAVTRNIYRRFALKPISIGRSL